MKLVTFEIQDGENSYEQYSILEKDLSEKETIDEVYGNDRDDRWYKVASIQDITKQEASILQKLSVAYFQ